MSDVAIKVTGLGKQYRIGAARRRFDTLRDALAGAAREWRQRLGGNGAATDESTIWALQDVAFEVKRGEVLGVIGRNGAGKSTLLKILARITEPTTGEVELRGRVGSLLEVGTGFHPELTGRENVFLNGAILGMRRREIARRFDEIVAFAGVEKFIDTPVKHYSSGMYMRLAFAVAAHLEPEILIVDEVLAVGDAEFQRKCLGKMDDVARGGRTVLFVSHNMQAIQELCGRVLWLDTGQLKAQGQVRSVMEQRLRQSDDRPTLGDTLLEATVRTLDGDGKMLVEWRTSELLSLQVTLSGLPAGDLPVVVVSCYRVDGSWLFTLESDMFCVEHGQSNAPSVTYDFRVTNVAIATCTAYVDIGVRESGDRRYAALFPRAAFISVVSTLARRHSHATPLLTLPASLSLHRADKRQLTNP